MHPLDNTTRFFAVVGAPYIPEAHFDDCCDEVRRHSSCAADTEHEHPQAADVTAWWPRLCH
jgi:hypothetical protein